MSGANDSRGGPNKTVGRASGAALSNLLSIVKLEGVDLSIRGANDDFVDAVSIGDAYDVCRGVQRWCHFGSRWNWNTKVVNDLNKSGRCGSERFLLNADLTHDVVDGAFLLLFGWEDNRCHNFGSYDDVGASSTTLRRGSGVGPSYSRKG